MVGTQENPVEIDEARFAGRENIIQVDFLMAIKEPIQLTVKQVLKTTETTGEE